MRIYKLTQCSRRRAAILPLAVSVALVLLFSEQAVKSTAAQSGGIGGSGSGGILLGGGASSSASGSGSSSAEASAQLGGVSSSIEGQASGSINSSGGSFSGASSSGLSGGSSLSASTSLSSGGSIDQSARASASLSFGSTTSKPEGLLGKVKEIFKEGKEAVKSSVGSLTKLDERKPEISAEASGSMGSSSSSLSASGSLASSSGSNSAQISGQSSIFGSGSGSGSGSSSSSSSGSSFSSVQGAGSTSASAQISVGQKQEGEGLFDKLSDMAKKGKETIKEAASEVKEKAKEVKEDIKQAVGLDGKLNMEAGGSSGAGGASGSIKLGGLQASANLNVNSNNEGGSVFGAGGGVSASASGGGSSGASASGSFYESGNKQGGDLPAPIEKVQKFVNKGSEVVRETVHKIEDKASEVGEKVSKSIEDNFRKPMSQVSGSGQLNSEGRMTAQASANVQLKGEARERHLMDVKRKQESELGQRPSNLKDIISQAKAAGTIPKNEDRSALAGNHADEKSVAVEVLDKMHEISKLPVEKVLKPLDKVLGYEKDPLIRIYDNSHEILRAPIGLVSKPVESMLNGAFKTTDEAKRDTEKLLQTTSEQERREARLREERARKEHRTVVGEIADRTIELAEKPIEIILKPVDHLLGLDKNGKKNPLLRMLDDIYGLSKKPVDALSRPFETVLRKMADGEDGVQVSVRIQPQGVQSSASVGSAMSDSDPKLFTRLADGALNIADRVITKPLEIVMKPLNHALGYDEPGKRNPIVDAAHSLKNATKLGFELFTKPLDRIIKEVAEIGAIKDDSEREALLERKREEASRLVRAMDKFHELMQSQWEVVLRPVDNVLGISREGKKEPLLRAWDVIHQVLRTPIQVVSKPLEDAILGEAARRPPNQRNGASAGVRAQVGGHVGSVRAGASVNVGGGNGGAVDSGASVKVRAPEDSRRNFIIEGIKKVEKLAVKPLDVITSPIRHLILGEDDEKVGSHTEKNNRAIQAKAMGQTGNGRMNSGGPDKIVKTIENMNNVVLKPFEMITQPIVDILSRSESQRKIDVKVQGQAQGGGSSAQAQAQIKKN